VNEIFQGVREDLAEESSEPQEVVGGMVGEVGRAITPVALQRVGQSMAAISFPVSSAVVAAMQASGTTPLVVVS